MKKKLSIALVCSALCSSAIAATDMPYIGMQTRNTADAYNDGSIRSVEHWGSGVSDAMGDKFGYITPDNSVTKGGLWAGDKASGITYGDVNTGVFVDKDGAKIKNTDLDVTGNTIKNLKDGVNDGDAVNVSQLNESAESTIKTANSYTDGKASEALNTANNYADSKASATLNTANGYADGKASEALNTANGYADGKASEALNTANGYADGKASEALNTANGYADGKASEALNTANNYTDSKVSATLRSANAYTDKSINRLERKVNRGLASTAALSGLFQPYGVGKFNFSAGVGGYRDESAIAMGSGYRFNENVAVKMGVSMSAEGISSAMYNASVNVEW
ncbi:YadA-like family protein [Pectobacterium parmentieri]|uniref:YadA-like family protein n=1 Tax=Pectobacterium parmentieri TaxID=1905730 RepID=UPI0018E049F0|nr:YadA-like family protein [Pectobacterium parmentieri]MBI0573940.1 hypothetical protein [Pectobacterium parmentieri]